MSEDLLGSIQDALRARWERKLPKIIERARNFASAAVGRLGLPADERALVEKALREAHATGYREGYWEGVIDVVECGAKHAQSASDERADAVLVH
jgi:hypothetical protein